MKDNIQLIVLREEENKEMKGRIWERDGWGLGKRELVSIYKVCVRGLLSNPSPPAISIYTSIHTTLPPCQQSAVRWHYSQIPLTNTLEKMDNPTCPRQNSLISSVLSFLRYATAKKQWTKSSPCWITTRMVLLTSRSLSLLWQPSP